MIRSQISKMKQIINVETLLWTTTILLAIVIRIPRVPHLLGEDAFEVVWMIKAVQAGALKPGHPTWLIHPTSFFGLYPFSQYPIGYILIAAFVDTFIFSNLSIEFTAFLLSLGLTLVAGFGALKLGNELFDSLIERWLFVTSYIIAPVFLKFSYNTINTRGPVMALMPLFLFFVLKIASSVSYKNVVGVISIFSLMVASHAFSLVTGTLIIILATSKSLQELSKLNIWNRLKSNRIVILSFYLSSFFAFIVLAFAGYTFFGVQSQKVTSPWFQNSDIFGLIMNLVIDYGLRLGIISVFFPVGVIYIVKNAMKTGNNTFFYFTLYLLAFCWTITLYATPLFLSIYLFLSLKGYQVITGYLTKFNQQFFIPQLLCLGSIFFTMIYALFIANVLSIWICALLSFFSLVIMVATIFANRLRLMNNHNLLKNLSIMVLLFLSTTSFALTANDGIILASVESFPYAYISSEEIAIIDEINSYKTQGIVFVTDERLAITIGGAGFLPTIFGRHGPQQLYYGWITPEEVYNSTDLDIAYFVNHLSFPRGIDGERAVLDLLRAIDVNSTDVIPRLVELNIQFAVVLKDEKGEIYPYFRSLYGKIHIPFLQSLSLDDRIFETDHLILWKFF